MKARRNTLPLLLLAAGVFITAVHDYAYRRVGGTDFEVYGLVSHAGTDMLIVVAGLVFIAALWERL